STFNQCARPVILTGPAGLAQLSVASAHSLNSVYDGVRCPWAIGAYTYLRHRRLIHLGRFTHPEIPGTVPGVRGAGTECGILTHVTTLDAGLAPHLGSGIACEPVSVTLGDCCFGKRGDDFVGGCTVDRFAILELD